jgi:hypothetical protein
MRAPIARTYFGVPPRAVHVDERHRWLCSMQCHNLAAKRRGLQQRSVVKLLADAPALVGGCNGELTERPRMWLAKKVDLGMRVWPGQCDGCDDFATDLANEADAAAYAFLGVSHRLLRCPVAQPACSVKRIRSVDELSKRVQIVRCGNASHVQMV